MNRLLQMSLAALIMAAMCASGAYATEDAATTDTVASETPVEATGTSPDAAIAEEGMPLRIHLGIYSWLPGITSTVKADGSESTTEIDFGTIIDAMDFANFAHLELQRGKWGVLSELDFVKLSEDTEFRSPGRGLLFKTEADLALKQTMAELALLRSFDGKRVGFDAIAGARYFRLESKVHVGPIRSNDSTDWVDPMIGGRLRLRLSDKWQASLRADLAGFGAGSELSTNIVGTVGYNITDRHTLAFGYRYMDIDYEADDLEVSMTTYGPLIGMVIRF
ncbi:MAG: hypothetical protein IT368_03415 [Candidatus Hydrogenedentes bacterium]|nr:hypothetical protein [Candidatus Hydrogenedentota bacterium]